MNKTELQESTVPHERVNTPESTLFKERAEKLESTVSTERHWGDPLISSRGIISFIIALALWQPALAQQPTIPNPSLTPGSILDTDPVVICTPGYDKTHRVWRNKRGTAAKYGVPWSVAQGMEDDDLVPVGLGGNNADPKNHWLQPWGEALHKDDQERHDETLVCRVLHTIGAGAASLILRDRQQYYLTNGWAK